MAMSSPSGTTKPGDDPITDFDPSEDTVELVGFGGSLSAETGSIELDLGGSYSLLLLGRIVADLSAGDFNRVKPYPRAALKRGSRRRRPISASSQVRTQYVVL
jgi:hypothetical protein